MPRALPDSPPDFPLLIAAGSLVLFGLVALSSASISVGLDLAGDPYYFIRRQIMYGFLPGIFFGFIAYTIHYGRWNRLSLWIFGLSVLLLVLVAIPGIGTGYTKDARSWFTLFGASFQPAEAAKLALIIFLASFLDRNRAGLASFRQGFLPALAIGSIPVVLVLLQPDVGTATILFSIVFCLLFFAGAQWRHLLLLMGAGLSGFVLMVALAPYRLNRLMTFLHPELDPQGIGYHINQAFLAIGSGGWLGLGLGRSQQKFQYLPEVHADSIFAVIAEELGFVISLSLIALILFILLRLLKLAQKAPDDFGRLLLAGIAAWIGVQSFFNIGAMLGLLPLTGVPLPFVSHGGSALLIGLTAIGIALNVSRECDVRSKSR
ncbi:MAG: Stage V sporulation protein E [Candidatus Magasanikbacteria bacterium GW2011_GWA2_56_11]|uniref:Probable peptidoglycan glycosyltransferase FtsW n=1 Tax=Candidatus Magasanikbacteria bacterium GW2011_GWA2_56_11 TaxID=1619044 RepID=A0A0G1YDP9_9BACT|nr:MAG: Stage V sporulation protein E [Candidatus Magasanikbacteria bacterium GW2011_GWA2_56_11]